VPLIYQGGQTETAVRLAECFREAVRCAAAALVFVHCHPSGDPTPSPDDVRLTREAGDAGALLGIDVLDHVVVAGDGFVSLREAGLYVPPPAYSDDNVPARSSSSLVRLSAETGT
jgi:DNA repair protein RadC